MAQDDLSDLEISKMSTDSLLKNLDKPGVGRYFLSSYKERLNEIPIKKRPVIAEVVASSLMELAKTSSKDEVGVYFHVITNVTRIGLNAFFKKHVKKGELEKLKDTEIVLLVQLYFHNALSLLNNGRPIRALDQINRALGHLKKLQKKSNSNDEVERIRAFIINESICSLYYVEAGVFLNIIPAINGESRRKAAEFVSFTYNELSENTMA